MGDLLRFRVAVQQIICRHVKLNPLDLTDRDLVFGPVVKFGGPWRLMRSHLLSMLEPASILQVNRHTVARQCQEPRVPRSFPNR